MRMCLGTKNQNQKSLLVPYVMTAMMHKNNIKHNIIQTQMLGINTPDKKLTVKQSEILSLYLSEPVTGEQCVG